MISYDRDPQQTIPESSVKIVGLGGAGANMLDRATLNGLTGAETLCLNTDVRTLKDSKASEKIQMGKNLTMGLGAGGDPEVGLRAAQESEQEIRDAFRNRSMVFLCVGLGGGTGSGAAPLICRLAREAGAFVVVFATMPFTFEGARRMDQAETSLNELSVLANALVTFDNNRMGELVVAKQGIHEAFAAADLMIAESVKAVTRLVLKPGLINVGLDDLMSALRAPRSRCLFGSGMGKGENRTQLALENTLSSPLLDQGSLLKNASTVLVHICGGEDLTLYEVELLMQGLSKHVPKTAHLLFGAAVDASMGDSLSVTLVSALPEDQLVEEEPEPEPEQEPESEPELVEEVDEPQEEVASELELEIPEDSEEDDASEPSEDPVEDEEEVESEDGTEEDSLEEEEDAEEALEEGDPEDLEESIESEEDSEDSEDEDEDDDFDETEDEDDEEDAPVSPYAPPRNAPPVKSSQPELELEGAPKGRFEQLPPNMVDGEDLDIPPFLRKKMK